MNDVDETVYRAVVAAAEDRRSVALATVVAARGSTPSAPNSLEQANLW